MTREDELIRLLESYLDEIEGNTSLPPTVRGAVSAELPTTRQAAPARDLAWHARMSNAFKVGIAAAVIGLAALIGFSLHANWIGIPPPPPTTTPTPTPVPVATPGALPTAASLEAGTDLKRAL